MKNPVRLAKTTLIQDDSGVAPVVQIQYLSQAKNSAHAAPYGVHSSPVLNTPCLMITINNDPANTFVFPLSFVERKNLEELKEGEIAIGNFSQKSNILFDENGDILINTENNLVATVEGDSNLDITGDLTATVGGTTDIDSTGDVTVTAPNTTINSSGNINLTGGNVILSPATTIDGKVFLTHTHSAGSYLDSLAGAVTGSSGVVI